MLEGFSKKTKQRIALYLLQTLVDECGGFIEINDDTIKRVFKDEDKVLKFENVDGEVAEAKDLDFEALVFTILKWKNNNPNKWHEIDEKVDDRARKMGFGL